MVAEPDIVGAQSWPRIGVMGRKVMSTRTQVSFRAAMRFATGQSVVVQLAAGTVPVGWQSKKTLLTLPNGATIRLAALRMSAAKLLVAPVTVAGQTCAPGLAAVMAAGLATQAGSSVVVLPIHRASAAASRAP